MNYQLVALFEQSDHTKLKDVQRTLCKKMNLYKPVPLLNIPICTLIDADPTDAENTICKVLSPYKYFKVNVNNTMSLSKDNKVFIEIEQSGYISTIHRNIVEYFSLNGVKLGTKSPDLIIPISNGNYNFKKLKQKNSTLSVLRNKPADENILVGKIVKFELWRLGGRRKDNVIVSFPLRAY